MKTKLPIGLAGALLLGGSAGAVIPTERPPKLETTVHTTGAPDAAPRDVMPADIVQNPADTATDQPSPSALKATQAAPESMAKAGQAQSLQGRVAAVQDDRVTVTANGASRAVRVDSGSTVLKDGHVARLSELKPGDEVRVSYDPRGDKLFARTINATSGLVRPGDEGVQGTSSNTKGSSETHPAQPQGRPAADPTLKY